MSIQRQEGGMKMIIVVGADNTGKTSLVEHLTEKFDFQKAPRYHTLPPKDYHEWAHHLLTVLKGDTSNVIADRFLLDEFVYGPLKRQRIGLHFEDQLELTDAFRNVRPHIILCEVNSEVMAKTFAERDQYPSLDENIRIAHAFHFLLRLPPFSYCMQKIYDFTRDPNYRDIDSWVAGQLGAKPR
jgi:thymidylate kinase